MNKSKVLSLALILVVFGLGVIAVSSRNVSAAPAAVEERSLQTLPSQGAASNRSREVSAEEASSEFSNGGKSLGRGFVKGTQLAGHTFEKTGMTVAASFKKAGRAIRGYFTGKNESEVQESDLGGAPPSRNEASQKLDAVGNELPARN